MAQTADHVRIAVVGSTMTDQIAYVPRAPEAGETLVGDRFQMGFGGKGANQAVMARRFGAQVWMVNCVGDDTYGELTLANFADVGVDTTFVRTVAGSSGVAPIWVEADGTNRIVIVPGANLEVTPEHAREAIESLGDLDVVVGQFEIPQEATTAGFAAARAAGAITVLNPAPAAEILPDLLAVTDWLVPNEVEFSLLSGGGDADDDVALVDFAKATSVRLLVTLGAAGIALVGGDGTVERIRSPKVDAIDTTGAGDAFLGAFAVGLALFDDTARAYDLGMRAASDSVTRPGTQSSFASPDDCATMLADLV